MNLYWKIAIVLLGYGLALAGASVAAFLENLRTTQIQASGGMAAFGGSLVFAGTFAVMCVPPTALGLWFLRSWKKGWFFLTYAAPALACTAPLALMVNAASRSLGLWSGVWGLVDFAAMLRVMATPVMAMAFGVVALVAPEKRTRQALWLSMGIELFVAGCVFIYLAVFQRVF